MNAPEVLTRKNAILQRNLDKLILRKNRLGLSRHESMLMRKFLREYHDNLYQLKMQ